MAERCTHADDLMGFRILFGGVASWFNRGVNIVLGLALMPVLFRHLSKTEVGVWLLLGQSWVALGVFDLGFGAILTRKIAFTVGGNARDVGAILRESRLKNLVDLVITGRRVYRWLAVCAFGISFGAGLRYLGSLELHGMPVTTVWTAWGILCLSQALAIWAASWTCVLQGLGLVGWDAILASVTNSLTLLLQIVAVLIGGGLVSLAAIAAVGVVLQRLLLRRFVLRRNSALMACQGNWDSELCREMAGPALRAWLTSLGYLLVANTDQFFIAAQQGTDAIPAYRASFLLVINLHLLAGVFSGASQVFVSQLWKAGEVGQIRVILRRNARIGLCAMACGAGAIWALGPVLFEFWLGPGNFIGYPVLGIFLATFILEHHANVFSSCGRATNDEAYAVTSLATGLLKVLLAWLLMAHFGLIGLALSTLVAQATINDWFMVYRSSKRLGVDLREHFKEVLLPVLGMLLAALGVGVLVNDLTRENRPGARVSAVISAAGLILAIGLWRLALSGSQRHRVLRFLRFA